MRDCSGAIGSCAEDGASGWCMGRGALFRRELGRGHDSNSPTQQQQARRHRVAIITHRRRRGWMSSGPTLARSYGITILRDQDAQAFRRASVIGGEFDPGSGSTLAACLMHASRARTSSGVLRGGRVRNTWATCPGVGDSRGKPRVIPHTFLPRSGGRRKGAIPPLEGPAAD